jgi:16S rRNA (cytosine967-C5)-methyltransferase
MTGAPRAAPVGPTARTVAASVLARVERDGAFAAAVLDAELERAAQLDARDRGLATELTYGALRALPWLIARIERHAPRGIGNMEPHARASLVIAAYQLFFLSRVPPFAAVNEAVSAVTARAGAKVGAFANAVLRKVSADAARERPAFTDAAAASVAPWLVAALERALGADGARAFIAAGAEPPPTGVRIEDASARDAWLARLREARAAAKNAAFELGRVSPHAILARGAGRMEGLPGYADGAWTVQEEGSQLVALALGARAGDAVLDACAGRGNKTSLLARAVLSGGGAVDACDLHASKLERLRRELARLGLAPRATYAVDWSAGSGDVTARYDRVLVDAPCSGVGTLRRRPDLAARRAPEDLAALGAAQTEIAARAAEHVRPGGRLVYAVCSVLREESEEVVAALLARHPSLCPAPFDAPAARALAGDAPTLRLLPDAHGTDGYFVASFVRVSG